MAMFPDPIPNKFMRSVGKRPVLVVTSYGTIKGDKEFKEQTIDVFIKNIERNMKTWYVHFDDDTYKYTVKNHSKVIDNGDDSFVVVILDYEYDLKLDVKSKYYPILKSKLDELNKQTRKSLNHEKAINDFEENSDLEEHENQEDLQTYLKFLNGRKTKWLVKFIINTLISTILNGGLLYLAIAHFLTGVSIEAKLFSVIIPLLVALVSNLVLEKGLKFYNKTISLYRILKLIKLKIKDFTRRLNKLRDINIKINSQLEEENEQKKDIHKETIINYMNTIMIGANKLKNKKEIYVILTELRDVLDEYTARMQKYNTNHGKGLNLEEEKTVIMKQTIEKLVTLEMKISEIRKRENENKLIIDDSLVLREKLNGYIDAIDKNDKDTKVRVRTMQ